jgi:hypothetical protein
MVGLLILALSQPIRAADSSGLTTARSEKPTSDEGRDGESESVKEKPPTTPSYSSAADAPSKNDASAAAREGPPPAPYHRERYSEPKPEAGELADSDPRAIADFRKELERSGEFMVDQRYGTVWVPDPALVGDDFAPYVTHGRWALNENDDWVWMSDFSFGNIVFHYGRWVYVPEVGWAWIPGRKYAAAWVEWRVPDEGASTETQIDYVGWAPTPPTFIWYGGVAYSYGYVPVSSWVYCPSPWVFAYPVAPYVVHDRGHAHHAWRYTHPYAPGAHAGHHGHGYVPAGPPLDRARIPEARRPLVRVPATDGATPVRVKPVAARGARVGAERGVAERGVADARRAGPTRPGVERAAAARESGRAAAPRYAGAIVRREQGRAAAPRYTGAIVPRERGVPARTLQGRVTRPTSVVRIEPTRAPPTTRIPATRTIGVPGPTMRGPAPQRSAPMRSVAPMRAPAMRAPAMRGAAPAMRGAAPMRAPAMRGAPPMRAPAMRGAPPMRAPAMRGAPPMRAPAMHGAPVRGGARGR